MGTPEFFFKTPEDSAKVWCMWPFRSNTKRIPLPSFTNTLTGQKELFVPHTFGKATIYSCGPTVYGPVQIGNLRSFILADLAARTLALAGYKVKRVMNITDVGHLVGDADEGEDKMVVGAKREQTTPEAIAERYTKHFFEDIEKLGIRIHELTFPRATAYIKEDIEMIRKLERKGFTYRTSEGIYFNTAKFPSYGALGNLAHTQVRAGARVALGEKRSPHDFVLWRNAKDGDLQKWESPWGVGNPGWSIECSVMSSALLGAQIDIHTGGEDLAHIHHNNEIAQSEAASGKHPFVRYWLHGAFLTIGGEKLSKSAGNSFTLADVLNRGIHPLALRYLFLTAHYRSPLSFSWEALQSAEDALKRLWKIARTVKKDSGEKEANTVSHQALKTALFDDIGTPQALALLWNTLQDTSLDAREKWTWIVIADSVFGLSLTKPPEASDPVLINDLPEDIQPIARNREEARKNKDFAASDTLRIHLKERGYLVEDGPSGSTYTKI